VERENDVTEVSWVRSVYLYLMTAVSIALIGLGAVGAVVGLVHTIAPDLGHRDTLDRVGVGVANIAGDVVDLMNESQVGSIESYCEDVTDSDDEFQECVEEESGFEDGSMESIQDGISKVKDELRSQIRNNSIDHLIRGLLLIAAGVVLFRIHGRRTDVFAGRIFPERDTPADPDPDPEPVTLDPIPPPPPAP
jgi:hypothetical protein